MERDGERWRGQIQKGNKKGGGEEDGCEKGRRSE